MTAKISIFPSRQSDVLGKVLEHAQRLKGTDPSHSIELHEQVIRALCREINNRNQTIRILQRLLLDRLDRGAQ